MNMIKLLKKFVLKIDFNINSDIHQLMLEISFKAFYSCQYFLQNNDDDDEQLLFIHNLCHQSL